MWQYIIHIDFIDYPGLGYKIFTLIEEKKIDKVAMEVIPGHGMALQIRCDSEVQIHDLLTDLRKIEHIRSISFRDQMPYKEREMELSTILNSISEGVLAIDKAAKISHINEVACKLLACNMEEVMGLPINELLGNSTVLLDTLRTGHLYQLEECKIRRAERSIRFLTSSIPILTNQGRIIGAVATLQDFQQVERVILKAGKLRQWITFDDIVHQSQKMARLIASARMVARSSSTILLRGESGSGKEVFAKAIHAEGSKTRTAFIPINCSALTDTLLESELFGYEEGTFTGALKGGKKGLFEQAHGGTLFLDEIGDISPRLQAQLLRVLQEGTIRRIGGNKEIEVDARIIAATNRNLELMVKEGAFREDLYYRLNVIPLAIPPLRERKEDIPLLTQHLIRKICTKLNKPEVFLTKESMDYLLEEGWPGNVRQLENTLERLINLTDTTEIRPEHIANWADISDISDKGKKIPGDPQALTLEIPLGNGWPSLKEIVAKVEKEVIHKVLEKHPSSRLAGQVLGVSNTTILNKIHEHSIPQKR